MSSRSGAKSLEPARSLKPNAKSNIQEANVER